MKQYEDYNDGFYHVAKDVEDYPDATIIVVWSKRGPGKTYGALWNSYWNEREIVYMKRTNSDVKLICTYEPKSGFDLSPYKPINRDKGTNIHGKLLDEGIGGFWTFEDDHPEGLPHAYVLSLNKSKSIKGIELSECDWMIMDEFVPQQGEVVKHAEGEMLLDLYMTILRDREDRGKEPIKLILFANAEEISTPITNTLEIVDDMAELNASGKTHMYLEDRGILLHHITNEEIPLKETRKRGIYKAMQGTKWAEKAFDGEFANNDFTNVKHFMLKGCTPLIHIQYKKKDFYIYKNQDGYIYMCSSRNKCLMDYNLDLENDQKKFYVEQCIDLRNACINGYMKFQKYSMYDLIINYKKFFKL